MSVMPAHRTVLEAVWNPGEVKKSFNSGGGNVQEKAEG